MGSRVCGALIQQTAYGASVRGGGPFCILRACINSAQTQQQQSEHAHYFIPRVHSFQFYDGIGLNHMAGNRSAAYSGEHLSTGRSERLSLMPTSPSGGLDLTALMQSMISKHNHEATMEEARRIKEAECYVRC